MTQPLPPATVEAMRAAADEAPQRAYCPYSQFAVGASVLTDDGKIFSGCNVENASYGLTICAERNAIFQAVASGHTKVRALVVATPTPRPTLPCGACRQVLREFAQDAEIYCFGTGGGEAECYTLQQLLPQAFGPDNLA